MFTEIQNLSEQQDAGVAAAPAQPIGFAAIALHAALHRALADAGYTTPHILYVAEAT